MKLFYLLLILIIFSSALFSQEYPEISYEELQNYEYTIIEEHEEFSYVEIDGIIYICQK